MKSTEIGVVRTEGEWERLEEIAKMLGKSDLRTFLHNEIWKLALRIEKCEQCVSPARGLPVKKTFYTSKSTAKVLDRIALISKRPRGAVINELIISRLLEMYK